jgi:hypothetical protein
MRVAIARGIEGAEIDGALPKRYVGLADAATRRSSNLTVLCFTERHVVTSADVARALRRLDDPQGDVVAFMGEGTVEAIAALRAAGARSFALRSFGWTDERYASIRQPRPRTVNRERGG